MVLVPAISQDKRSITGHGKQVQPTPTVQKLIALLMEHLWLRDLICPCSQTLDIVLFDRAFYCPGQQIVLTQVQKANLAQGPQKEQHRPTLPPFNLPMKENSLKPKVQHFHAIQKTMHHVHPQKKHHRLRSIWETMTSPPVWACLGYHQSKNANGTHISRNKTTNCMVIPVLYPPDG